MLLAASAGIAIVQPVLAVDYQTIPTQYIAKMYTEAFGRAPDSGSWNTIESYYLSNPCNATTLAHWGTVLFTAAEFNSDYPLPDPTIDKHVDAARVEALWRGAYNREPVQSELNFEWTLLKGTETNAEWTAIVNAVYASSEFATLATGTICAGQDWQRDPAAYYWNTSQVDPAGTTMPAGTTCGMSGTTLTQETLQAALNAAQPNGTVKLAQNAYVVLDGNPNQSGTPQNGLIIPPGVTLTTCQPSDDSTLPAAIPNSYALMGRLIRKWTGTGGNRVTWMVPNSNPSLSGYPDAAMSTSVIVENGGKVKNVWIDGNADVPTEYCQDPVYMQTHDVTKLLYPGWCADVAMFGGSGTSVLNSRVENGAGSDQLGAFGQLNGSSLSSACSGRNYIQGNLVLGYNTAHHLHANNSSQTGNPGDAPYTNFPVAASFWSDGINAACENLEVSANSVIDATDVSIISFRTCVPSDGTAGHCTGTAVAQQSYIHDNTVLATGNSSYAALWMSTSDTTSGSTELALYRGFTMTNNHLWTGVAARFDAGIVLGIRPDSGNPNNARRADGSSSTGGLGAFVTGNDTSGQFGYVGDAILVSGALKFDVEQNHFDTTLEVAGAGTGGLPSIGVNAFTGWLCPTTAAQTIAPMIAETYNGTQFWASGFMATTGSTPFQDHSLVAANGNGCMTQFI